MSAGVQRLHAPYSPLRHPVLQFQQHSISAWCTRKALLVTEAGLGREALLCMRANQNKPVVSAERKGKVGLLL